jgi:hypothetical protein
MRESRLFTSVGRRNGGCFWSLRGRHSDRSCDNVDANQIAVWAEKSGGASLAHGASRSPRISEADMLRRWLAAVLRRSGIRLPFTGVVCTQACQSIALDEHGAAQIVTRRTLVFLAPPRPGDLQGTFTLGPDESRSCIICSSPDAIELWRAQTGPGRLTIAWLPREAVSGYSAVCFSSRSAVSQSSESKPCVLSRARKMS